MATSRRDFLLLSTASAMAWSMGGCDRIEAAADEASAENSTRGAYFPKNFQWGTATAAFQIEGAATEDGKGPSIWDTFCKQPRKVENGDSPNIACDFYHRFNDDINLMVDLGVGHFRFSISWPRVLPTGSGPVNTKGLDFYQRLTDTLLAHGITPHATLYHWDLPQFLEDKYGGWQSRRVVADFGNYASLVAKGLGDRIQNWMTLNEIASFTSGYSVGKIPNSAPGVVLKTLQEHNQVIHHALLAHGTACQALRANCSKPPVVSLAENYGTFVPIIETSGHVEAAQRAFMRENGGKIVPILTGQYDPGWMEDNKESLPDIEPNDLKTIHQPLDALGSNCYTGRYVQRSDDTKGYEIIPWFPSYPRANINWLRIVPESIYWSIRSVGEVAGCKSLPIFISENGYPDGVEPGPNGVVPDIDRIMYYRSYLAQVSRAIAEKYPVTGYFPWSLLDNFEWSNGYAKRFGLVRVDYATQIRSPKLSYSWYREVIRQNRIV